MIRRDENGKYVIADPLMIGDPEMELSLGERRKELLIEWMQEQLDAINEGGAKSATSRFFAFNLIPTSMGSELAVYCIATDAVLDLTLIDDEAW